MTAVPEKFKDLLSDSARAFAYLATLMDDGTPQVTPVWFNMDGDFILVNSATGRVKDKNMRTRPHVALVIADPHNPYRYIQIRGTVVDFIMEGAKEHIDQLNFKYHGNPDYPSHDPLHPRVIYKIKPEKVQAKG